MYTTALGKKLALDIRLSKAEEYPKNNYNCFSFVLN